MLLCLYAAGAVHAQRLQAPAKQIKIIARPDSAGTAIRLRWAAGNSVAWKYTNQYGFMLERYTILRNGVMLDQPERKLLGSGVIKAKPLNEWEATAKTDQYAAVLAQALYGNAFQVGGVDGKGVNRIVSQSQETQQRFNFSLFAADMSFPASLLAGWAWVDNEVRPGEKYLYRLTTGVPVGIMPPDTASVFIGAGNYEPLPAVQDINAKFGNHMVLLAWDYGRVSDHYSSYYVERSDDEGKTFHRLSNVPVANLNDKGIGTAKRMYLTDTLHDNAVVYQYRVRGIDPFGETGPPSATVKGQGSNVLPFVPGIQSAYIDDKGMLQLQWSFEEKANALIKGFRLNKASRSEGPYSVYIDSIGAGQRKLLVKNRTDASAYYTLTALAKEGESRTSFPVLVQPLDSVPPAAPVGLKAVIDSNGLVTLTWTKNNEPDLMGYKIYRILKKEEEPVPLVDSVWTKTKYRDKLSLKMLNKKVYYAVSALDKRYNQSAISAFIEVKKPDIIPPSTAVITKYQVAGNRVTLQWINSVDDDIAAHLLYRKAATDTGFTVIQRFAGKSRNSYTDTITGSAGRYSYRIAAQSEGGLITTSEELSITIAAAAATGLKITRLYAYAQPDKRRVEVVWDDQMEQVVNYQVYKAAGNGALTLWKTIPAAEKGLYDTEVQPNTAYQYAVLAVLQSGAYSEMKKVSVTY